VSLLASITIDISQAERALDVLLEKLAEVRRQAGELKGLKMEIDEEVNRVLEGIETITFRSE
jgi:hypothetical protein